jgi:hypothetical protein
MATRARRHFAAQALDESIRKFAPKSWCARDAYWRLINTVRSSSRLLTPFNTQARFHKARSERVVEACARMALHEPDWARPPEAWQTTNESRSRQFLSLANHLFARYPVPSFMTLHWLIEYDQPWERELYLHLARGYGVRQFELPLGFRLTKAGARCFMQAPDHLSPMQALRWAHVRSLGGDQRLARTLLRTVPLFWPTDNEPFWETVISFLIQNQPLQPCEVEEIVDFIQAQRHLPAERVWGPGAGEQPLQPDFSLRGRSLHGLRRHMIYWRAEHQARLSAATAPPTCRWPRTSIGPFHLAEGSRAWTIDELLSDRELRVEGGIMRHCVASYIHDCARRRTTIWSMKVHVGDLHKRVLTIEVLPDTRQIWQAKGKRNAAPDAEAREILDRWARQERLTIRGRE